MNIKTIKKSIDIKAPAKVVFHLLQDDTATRNWYAAFSEGTYADTDWKIGSKAVFSDKTKNGIIGKIVKNNPNEELSVQFEGVLVNGKEDYDSAAAEQVKGAHETYVLSEQQGTTHLSISCDMAPEYFDSMSKSWEQALQKIKSLAENG